MSFFTAVLVLFGIMPLSVSVYASGTYIDAPGGTIAAASTDIAVAGMFEDGATAATTGNVSVTKSGNAFTVTISSNINLNGMITIGSGVSLQIISDGNYTIKRNFGYGIKTSYMFYLVNNINSALTLGSGTVANNTITYGFNDDTTETLAVGDTPPTSTISRYVDSVTVNATVTNEMSGTLTIDGGATLDPYTGTRFSFADRSNSTGNIIKMLNGTFSMWGGVTLCNNKNYGNDEIGGSAINIQRGSLYLYGGTITRCVNSDTNVFNQSPPTGSSLSDGGAILLNSDNAKGYIYNCVITQCESDNSSAISLWAGATLFFLDGSIHDNFAYGDRQFPAQAVSMYSTGTASTFYMYGGKIENNDGVNYPADVRVSSGSNVLHMFGGTIDLVGINSSSATVNINGGTVNKYIGLTDETFDASTIHNNFLRSFTVTIPETVTISANGNTVSGRIDISISMSNFRTSESLSIALASRNYDSSSSSHRLVAGDSVYLPYIISESPNGTNPLPNNAGIKTITGNGLLEQTGAQTLYISTDATPSYAGTYTDTLTFTVTLNP